VLARQLPHVPEETARDRRLRALRILIRDYPSASDIVSARSQKLAEGVGMSGVASANATEEPRARGGILRVTAEMLKDSKETRGTRRSRRREAEKASRASRGGRRGDAGGLDRRERPRERERDRERRGAGRGGEGRGRGPSRMPLSGSDTTFEDFPVLPGSSAGATQAHAGSMNYAASVMYNSTAPTTNEDPFKDEDDEEGEDYEEYDEDEEDDEDEDEDDDSDDYEEEEDDDVDELLDDVQNASTTWLQAGVTNVFKGLFSDEGAPSDAIMTSSDNPMEVDALALGGFTMQSSMNDTAAFNFGGARSGLFASTGSLASEALGAHIGGRDIAGAGATAGSRDSLDMDDFDEVVVFRPAFSRVANKFDSNTPSPSFSPSVSNSSLANAAFGGLTDGIAINPPTTSAVDLRLSSTIAGMATAPSWQGLYGESTFSGVGGGAGMTQIQPPPPALSTRRGPPGLSQAPPKTVRPPMVCPPPGLGPPPGFVPPGLQQQQQQPQEQQRPGNVREVAPGIWTANPFFQSDT
jgi:hypothetical protein